MSQRLASGIRSTIAVALASWACLGTALPRPAVDGGAGEARPWAFLRQHGVSAVFESRERALYRSLLPEVFELPDRLLVLVAVVHYDKVTPALVPYHEAYVMLHCRYRGETGLFALTMPVDDATANAGGREIGFPKYVADRITLREEGSTTQGVVMRRGAPVLEIAFTSDGSASVTSSSDDRGLPCFTLLPRGGTLQVLIVRRSLRGPRVFVERAGRAIVTSSEPWGRLLAGAEPVIARSETITGDAVFVLTLR